MSTESISEEWRPISGHESRYAVSDHGRVRNQRTGRILKACDAGRGYLAVSLYGGQRGRERAFVHRLVAHAFLGESEGLYARHLNDVKSDNRLENLAYGTARDNARDAVTNGVHPNARKTTCPSGHPYAGWNLLLEGRGRKCRACVNARKRRRRAVLANAGAAL